MYVVVVNQGEPGDTTDWSAFGPYTSEASADEVMGAVNDAAAEGLLRIERVIVMPLESGIAKHPDLVVKLLELLQAGENLQLGA